MTPLTPRCDICGRFMTIGSPGTSWVRVPGIDVPGWVGGDERDRCARCTSAFGRAMPMRAPGEVKYDMVCGVVA